MEPQHNLNATNSPHNPKMQEESPLERSTRIGKPVESDWRYLLAKIYQNLNGPPVLKKKKSTKFVPDEDSNVSSDTASFRCNCKKTKCLKLYCQCFAKGQYCQGCNCQGCNNNSENDVVRASIIDEMIEKNPNAFDAMERTKATGCICKKTGCLKKYCECYSLGKKCGEECKCVNCLNIQ